MYLTDPLSPWITHTNMSVMVATAADQLPVQLEHNTIHQLLCSVVLPEPPVVQQLPPAERSESPLKKRLKVEGEDIQEEGPTVVESAEPVEICEADANVEIAPAAECLDSSPQQDEETAYDYNISWAVADEKGYKNTFGGNRAEIHAHMEDVWWAADGDRKEHLTTKSGGHIFVLADGHGGVEAPRFFVSGAAKVVQSLLDSREWDLGIDVERDILKREVSTAFQILDASYASRKVEEYRRWIDSGSDAAKRPTDDGCTLVVNVIVNGWVVNINVGDSRTVIGVREDSEDSSATTPWAPIFASSDHNMTHPAKIHHIHTTGGQFIYPYGALKTVTLPSTPTPPTKPYTQLTGMRIYRPLTPQIRAVGVSHRRTLNLSATMGDLLFKVEPAVLSCVPDMEFIKLEQPEYVLVMATDGVWDHMRLQDANLQAKLIVDRVGMFVDGSMDSSHMSTESIDIARDVESAVQSADGCDSGDLPTTVAVSEPGMPPPSPSNCANPQDRLQSATRYLVERERSRNNAPSQATLSPHLPDLYFSGQFRYDDATAMVIHLTRNM